MVCQIPQFMEWQRRCGRGRCGNSQWSGKQSAGQCPQCERILCPSENAVDLLDEIESACLKQSKDALYLLSVGPTAKLIADDLFRTGRRVIDIGNLDMEYEWFLRKAADKVKLEKHKIVGEEANRQAGYDTYWDEVTDVIG